MSAGRKQKNEAAFVAVVAALVPAATLPGTTSQEDQTVDRSVPSFNVEHLGGPESPLNSGVYHDKVVVRVRSTADKQQGQADGAVKAAHAANVAAVLEALLKNQATGMIDVRDLASRLSAAQADYHVFGVINRGQVPIEPEDRTFVDGFLFEVVNGETDCT